MSERRRNFVIIESIVMPVLLLIVTGLAIVTHDYSKAEPIPVDQYSNVNIAKDGKAMVATNRTGAGLAPENTKLAFETVTQGKDFKINVFKLDVQMTKDEELVVLHDKTLDTTSDSAEVFGKENVKASEKTYEELRELNMGKKFVSDTGEMPYKDLSGEQVPENIKICKLEDVFETLSSSGPYYYAIEIKDKGELGQKACDKLWEILNDKSVLEKSVVGTFNSDITKYMEETYPNMPRSASIKESIDFYFDSLLNRKRSNVYYKFVALQIPDDDYVINFGTTRLINYAHKHNIAVQYWTINEEDEVKELSSKGADAIISDYPDMVYNALNGKV